MDHKFLKRRTGGGGGEESSYSAGGLTRGRPERGKRKLCGGTLEKETRMRQRTGPNMTSLKNDVKQTKSLCGITLRQEGLNEIQRAPSGGPCICTNQRALVVPQGNNLAARRWVGRGLRSLPERSQWGGRRSRGTLKH